MELSRGIAPLVSMIHTPIDLWQMPVYVHSFRQHHVHINMKNVQYIFMHSMPVATFPFSLVGNIPTLKHTNRQTIFTTVVADDAPQGGWGPCIMRARATPIGRTCGSHGMSECINDRNYNMIVNWNSNDSMNESTEYSMNQCADSNGPQAVTTWIDSLCRRNTQ